MLSTNPVANGAKVTIEWQDGGKEMTMTIPSATATISHEVEYNYAYGGEMFTDIETVTLMLNPNEDGKYAKVKTKKIEDEPKKTFSEIKVIKVVVPSLTAENIALATAQAGVEGNRTFKVEPDGNLFILVFEEYFYGE